MKLETSVEALIKEDPLLAGAAVFAAGAAIGMAIPRSGKNAWFGKGREAVVHKVQDMAHDAFEKVVRRASRQRQRGQYVESQRLFELAGRPLSTATRRLSQRRFVPCARSGVGR